MLTTRRSTACTPSVAMRPGAPLDALLESMFSGFPAVSARAFPAVNVWEDADNFFVEAELPGFTIEDISISLTDNQLTISGERTFELPAEAAYVRRERPSGKFTRAMRVSTDIDAEKVAATLKDGVLVVTLPKAPAVKPRRINVKAV